jgi:hypothetical protein
MATAHRLLALVLLLALCGCRHKEEERVKARDEQTAAIRRVSNTLLSDLQETEGATRDAWNLYSDAVRNRERDSASALTTDSYRKAFCAQLDRLEKEVKSTQASSLATGDERRFFDEALIRYQGMADSARARGLCEGQ